MKSKKLLNYAVVPARSGSKRFKNKNVYKLLNKPLFYYTIYFAKKLSFVDKIIFSTDSEEYIKLAKKIPNIVIHKRNKSSSNDRAMEEDVLNDLNNFYKTKKLEIPNNIVWLRPTNPLRCINTFEKAYKIYKKFNDPIMIVHETDSRIFFKKRNFLKPLKKEFIKKSMIRGQDIDPFYKIFSGEIFKHKKNFTSNFLGDKKRFIIAPKITNFDIDDESNMLYLSYLLKKFFNKYKKFLHK